MILFADKIELRLRLRVTGEAVQAEAIVDVGKAPPKNFRAVLVYVDKEESWVSGLKPFCCLIMTSFGINCRTEPSG